MNGAVVLVNYRSLPRRADTAEREFASLMAAVQAIE